MNRAGKGPLAPWRAWKSGYSRSCLWGFLVLGAVLFSRELPAAPPNILLIVSEDNGPELGCYGDPYARTPNLDGLAAEGIRFNRAFVAQAGCSQSRASILTGLYPHQHGQIGLATWNFSLYRKGIPNLPRRLKGAGYRTGIIGKLHINPASEFPFDFQEITGANFARKDLGEYAKHARSFIMAGEAPFFLSVNFPEAHDPWLRQVGGLPGNPQTGAEVKAMPYMGIDPPAMREMVADYYNCISRLDSLVGDLLVALRQSGKADNTMVIYLGDHGADMLRGKRTCYEGGLRIPLLLRWPGRIHPQTREELVSTIDLMPTLLAVAGAEPVPDLPGRDLRPLFEALAVEWRQYLFAEYHMHSANNYFPQRAVRNNRYKLIESLLPGEAHPDYGPTFSKIVKEAGLSSKGPPLDPHAAVAAAAPEVRGGYQRMSQPPRFELYDLKDDPYEFHNLASAPEHAGTLRALRQELAVWRRKTGDPLLNVENLRRLAAEVRSVKSKKAARKRPWRYPVYFFGNTPAPASRRTQTVP